MTVKMPIRTIIYSPAWSMNPATMTIHALSVATRHNARVQVQIPGAGRYSAVQPGDDGSRHTDVFYHARRGQNGPVRLRRDQIISRLDIHQLKGESLKQTALVARQLVFANDLDKIVVVLQARRWVRIKRTDMIQVMKDARESEQDPLRALDLWLWKPKK